MLNKNLIIFSITDFCNAKCKTCSFWKVKNPTFPNEDEVKKAVKNMKTKLNCKMLQITGGEPMSYPHIFELIKEANNNKIITQLMTNGSLLTKNKIKKLIDSGLKIIAFSIDHYDELKVYENRKLKYILAKIKENVHNIRETNNNILIEGGITITKNNYSVLNKIVEFALNDVKVDEVYFSFPIQSTNSTYKIGSEDESINFTNKELINITKNIIEIKKKYKNKIAHKQVLLKDLLSFYSNKPQKFACKAGENIFYVDNKLEVYSCMIKNEKLGNINKKIKKLKNVKCYDCPLQCFREASIYFNGINSVPILISQLLNKNYWKVIGFN